MTTNVQIIHLGTANDVDGLVLHVDNVERDYPHALTNPSVIHVPADDERRVSIKPRAFSEAHQHYCHSTQSLLIHHPSMNSRSVVVFLPRFQQGAVLHVSAVDAKTLKPFVRDEVHAPHVIREGEAELFVVYGHQSLIVTEVSVHA